MVCWLCNFSDRIMVDYSVEGLRKDNWWLWITGEGGCSNRLENDSELVLNWWVWYVSISFSHWWLLHDRPADGYPWSSPWDPSELQGYFEYFLRLHSSLYVLSVFCKVRGYFAWFYYRKCNLLEHEFWKLLNLDFLSILGCVLPVPFCMILHQFYGHFYSYFSLVLWILTLRNKVCLWHPVFG